MASQIHEIGSQVLAQPYTGESQTQATPYTGGYECKFVEEPSNDLKCLICLCVARDPLQHGGEGCGKIYCRVCISKYKKKNNKCPNCRRKIVTFKDVRSELWCITTPKSISLP